MEDPAILESKWRLNFELRKIKLMARVGRYDGMDDAKRMVENALREILAQKRKTRLAGRAILKTVKKQETQHI